MSLKKALKTYLLILLDQAILKRLFLGFCLVIPLTVASQPTTDEQLAAYYFQEEDFQKAALYYEKLYSSSQSDFYYDYYLQCLFKLKDYKEARKLVKNQVKINPSKLSYQVDLGKAYKAEGDDRKAEKQFEGSIEKLPPVKSKIDELAKAFEEAGEYGYALQTYEKGDKLLDKSYPFNFEKAHLYGRMQEYEKMFSEYLDLLNVSNSYLQSVQNELSRNMAFEQGSEQNDMLKQALLKQIQKNPQKTVFSELLIWVYMQENNYYSALIQSKALDKRLGENGNRVMELAHVAKSNDEPDVAVEALEYVIDKGPSNQFYSGARIMLMDVLNEKVTGSASYTQEDVKKLEKTYYQTIGDLGLKRQTVKLYKDLAHIQAFYLHKPDTAIQILEKAIQLPRIAETDLAECKIKLADIYLIQGFIWDASLLYSQVEKKFKYDRIGEIAKFKNAKISYYTGDFNWAKAQLNVLKGSTSKLIANDAMELSLIITDNIGVDTTMVPLEMFARADLLTFQNEHARAVEVLDSIKLKYPGHSLADVIYFQKYKIALDKQDFDTARSFLEKVITEYPTEITADNAIFRLAELYENHFGDKEKAMEYYKMLMTNYTGSLYVVEARKRFRDLRGDNLNLEQ